MACRQIECKIVDARHFTHGHLDVRAPRTSSYNPVWPPCPFFQNTFPQSGAFLKLKFLEGPGEKTTYQTFKIGFLRFSGVMQMYLCIRSKQFSGGYMCGWFILQVQKNKNTKPRQRINDYYFEDSCLLQTEK